MIFEQVYAIQRMLTEMGEAACYFIAICWNVVVRAGKTIDFLEDFWACVAENWIHYDDHNQDDPDNCYIDDAGRVFSYLMGEPGEWECVKLGPDYVLKDGEYGCVRYERKTTKGTFSHFGGLLPDGTVYDPLGNSLTFAQGVRQSVRVFRKIA